MLNKYKILAIIPARGGSKGIPNKNKRSFCGKPLLVWTLDAAKASQYIDEILVSTDDVEIMDIAKENDLQVPFIRPSELATDTAVAVDVVIHAIQWMKAHKKDFDIVIYLQPTSPLRTSDDIDGALELFLKKMADNVVSVHKNSKPRHLINVLPVDGNMSNFILPENANKNRQDNEDFFQINGAMYISWSDYIYANRSWYGDKTFAYIMPESRSIDIDSELDFYIAECLMNFSSLFAWY